MGNKTQLSGPIAIGALGGSGTRVYAEILREVGFYIGNDLYTPLDNLWFALLFKRRRWFLKHHNNNESQIFKRISIFEKIMTGSQKLKFGDFMFIMKAAIGWSIMGNHFNAKGSSGRGLWPFGRVWSIIKAKPDFANYIGWGWKEPNTHIYLEYLMKHFDNLKYIHVIRHGLDMAYSTNQAQLFNWGKIYGINDTHSSESPPKKALEYWIKTNEKTINLGKKMNPNRFLIANYEKLCLNPDHEINKLLKFLGIKNKNVNMDKLLAIPKLAKSVGRYKEHDLSIFSRDEIETVRKFGFTVAVDR